MKTLDWTLRRINEIIKEGENPNLVKKDANKLRKEIQQLQMVKMYLEHEPRREFIDSEILRLAKLIPTLNDGYREWLNNNPKANLLKNPKSKYEKEVKLPTMRKQLKALKFILTPIK